MKRDRCKQKKIKRIVCQIVITDMAKCQIQKGSRVYGNEEGPDINGGVSVVPSEKRIYE